MNSHEYAAAIKKQAEYLESKPQFEMPQYTQETDTLWYMHDKKGFIQAVRTLGAGQKNIGVEYVEFAPTDAPITVKIERGAVCKLVAPAQYDCEPLLSQEEYEALPIPQAVNEVISESDIPF